MLFSLGIISNQKRMFSLFFRSISKTLYTNSEIWEAIQYGSRKRHNKKWSQKMEYNGTKYLQASAIWHQGPRSLFDKFLSQSQLLSQMFHMMQKFLTNTNISRSLKSLYFNHNTNVHRCLLCFYFVMLMFVS